MSSLSARHEASPQPSAAPLRRSGAGVSAGDRSPRAAEHSLPAGHFWLTNPRDTSENEKLAGSQKGNSEVIAHEETQRRGDLGKWRRQTQVLLALIPPERKTFGVKVRPASA